MSRISHSFVAIGAAAALLALVSWLDVLVLMEARRTAAATFDSPSVVAVMGIASFVVAATCLVLAWLAWTAGSLNAAGTVGAAMLIVGITSAMRSLRRPTPVDGSSGPTGVSASP